MVGVGTGVFRASVLDNEPYSERAQEWLRYALLLRRAYDLATTYNLTTAYDTLYLAVAERYQCEFWTLDEKLFNSVGDKLPWVKWIAASLPPT